MRKPRSPVRARRHAAQAVEVDIDELGVRGDGVADWRSRRLFVPFALAGERVRTETVGETADGVHARLVEVLSPSVERVVPPCRHFGICGGCALQHMAPPAMAAWKRERVAVALEQRGLAAPVAETVSIAPGTRRRATLGYRVIGRGAVVGFNARASRRLVDLAECPILDPRLAGLIAPLRDLLRTIAEVGESGDLALTLTDTGIDLCIDLAGPLGLETLERLAAFGRDHGLARLSWRRGGHIEPIAAFREPILNIGGTIVAVPPGAFLQASPEGEAALAGLVAEGFDDAYPVADLFSGLGTFALRLAAGGEVAAMDGDASLIDALARTRRVPAAVRDLFRAPLAGDELTRFASVVFDPPRAGARAQAEALAAAGPATVVAVSCNPATFARDARILADGGYRFMRATPVDQFPWSAHVELVAVFTR